MTGKKTLPPLFMDGVQLPQGYSHFEKAVYFLPLSSKKLLVLILSTSEGWKAESTLEPPSGFEHGTTGLGIHPLNQWVMFNKSFHLPPLDILLVRFNVSSSSLYCINWFMILKVCVCYFSFFDQMIALK